MNRKFLYCSAWLAAGLFSAAAAATPFVGAVMLPYQGPTPKIKAGVASADPSGFLGASAGQYAGAATGGPGSVYPNRRDPQAYSTSKQGSYGVQSRLTTRALVVEGANGKRIVLLKTDHYLAQDIFLRRIAQILATGPSGITMPQILHHVTHNHSSPYQLTQSAGVWVFQDAFNAIAFENEARAAASAIEQAVANLKPARMGAMNIPFNIVKANIVGASTAIDGTAAGYPRGYGDDAIAVMRFDDLSDPAKPKPLAVWMNHGQHPESYDGYHLVSGDYVVQAERFLARDTNGALLVFSQGDVGSSEGPYADRGDTPDRILPNGVYREWAHNGYAQSERAGRIVADAVLDAYNRIGSSDASVTVPYTTDVPVDFYDYWVTGPVSHPYPSVSNCSAAETYQGDPGVPVAGLPDCARGGDSGFPGLPDYLTLITGGAAGQAAPSHYDAPGHPAVEENQRLHLQTLRVGEVLLASCACEAQVDLILNLESRTDNKVGNIYDGFDWACLLPGHDSESVCIQQKNYFNPAVLPAVPGPNRAAAAIAHFRAQVHNNALGWDAPANAVAAQAQEPADITAIWGNFTKEELPANLGYKLPIGIGHAGDYNGYTVSYREYMSRDSYRKALTSYGPHTADYMATRLTRMAGFMKGGPAVPAEPNAAQGAADEQRQSDQATTVGQQTNNQFNQRLASAPNDPMAAAITQQPLASLERYRAAVIKWRGGSNAVDNPKVKVERQVDGVWQFFADQSGEVQSLLNFPTQAEEAAARSGSFVWNWTASFEAFQPFPATLANGTVNGIYRFVIDGQSRVANANAPYHFESTPFEIKPWSGIAVSNYALDASGNVSFSIAPYLYPRTYASPFLQIADDGRQTVCKTCTFRPWAKTGAPQTAVVTVTRADGRTETIAALVGSAGTWQAATRLAAGDSATLARGGVLDNNGEINGAASTLSLPVAVIDSFRFIDRVNVPVNTFVTSEAVTLSGFAGLLNISIGNGGQYSIDGAAFTNAPGQIAAGSRLTVRHVSAATESTEKISLVTVGGNNVPFRSVTTSADRVPDAFNFGRKDGQQPGALVESAVITPVAFNTASPIVAGPDVEYRIIGSGSYTRANGSLQPGQALQVRHASNTQHLGYTKSYLKVGGVTGYFLTRSK